MGGLFGAFGVVAALLQRDKGGPAKQFRVGLFENCLLLVAQHMVQFDIEGVEAPPMPERAFSWPVYDIFETADARQLFIGAVTEGQWQILCDILNLAELQNDPRLQTRMDQIDARHWTLPIITNAVARSNFDALVAAFEPAGIPFAPVHRPAQMYDDPHVNRPGGLVVSKMPDGSTFRAPGIPFDVDGKPVEPDNADIASIGCDTQDILSALGLSPIEIAEACGKKSEPVA